MLSDIRKAGVDLGGSLTKIAFAGDPLHFSLFPSTDHKSILDCLGAERVTQVALTGGGSVTQRALFTDLQVEVADEFESSIRGTNYLLEQQGGAVFPYALVSIGTGTSISKVEPGGGKRVTGTAVGGGTLLGLGSLLTQADSYSKILSLAAAGDRSGVDVLVRDIYGGDIPGLSGDITASNFGKAASRQPEDLARALVQMVGEVLAVIACLAAGNVGAKQVVYIGSSLRENPLLVEVLESITGFMGQQPRFVEHSEYAGAIGALLNHG